MMRPARTVVALLCGLALAALTPPARASKTFPEALRGKLLLSRIAGPGEGCQLCHQDEVGGLKTATKPLGRSLLQAGVVAANVPSLLAALDLLESDATDSDQDGTPDITELKTGTDPNAAPDGAPTTLDAIPLPETGCTLGPPPSPLLTWPALGVALLLLARRRTAPRR